jgi:uncharacterized protein (TIGR00269 family)
LNPRPCDHCAGPAIAWQRYSGARLCARHLHESVQGRARKEFNQATLPGRGARLLVAYSGGKDSTVALHLVHALREHRPGLEIVALTVDEGIAGYRPEGLAVAQDVCRELGVEQLVRRTKDLAGASVDEAHASDAASCGFCGVFRRRIMNDVAKEVGADAVVTGHNLDDVAQSILMNLASANLEKLAKLAPHDDPKPGFVPRILPLRTVPETEVYLYAFTKGLRWHEAQCPYADGALRGVYRDALYRLEEARPGTRHALLKTHEALRPLLRAGESAPMKACGSCGKPTSGDRCKACEFRAMVTSA